MRNILLLATITLILFSCSSKDEQFCTCLKAGDELNVYSSKLFDKVITPGIQKEMQKLKADKQKACKNYQTMSGEKMMELKKECE